MVLDKTLDCTILSDHDIDSMSHDELRKWAKEHMHQLNELESNKVPLISS